MSQVNFYNRLILHPKPWDFQIQNFQQWVEFLKESGFIADAWSYEGQLYYLIGNKFLSQIMFMGCAPSIEFEPKANNELAANFVAVAIKESLPQAIFYPPKREYHYRCPSCKEPIGPLTRQTVYEHSTFSCANCQKQFYFHSCRWRHQAGVGHCFIEVMGIFPQEAIPDREFMEQLKVYTGVPWDYFYVSKN